MFDRVLIALFKEQSKWASNTASDSDLSKIWQIAVSAGLNEQRARDYLTENKFSNVISRDLKQIEELKITRTPTFYVNGEKLEQLEPDQFKQLVNKKIREAKS
jgi:protein-disulfide isomerase